MTWIAIWEGKEWAPTILEINDSYYKAQSISQSVAFFNQSVFVQKNNGEYIAYIPPTYQINKPAAITLAGGRQK